MLLLACASIMAFAQIERPKLVVGIIIDQMRWDALYYYTTSMVMAVSNGCSTMDSAVRTT